MANSIAKPPAIWKMALSALRDGGPGICHFAITSTCNARCGFRGFARDRLANEAQHSVPLAEAKPACDILKRNGVRFLHFYRRRAAGASRSDRDGRLRDRIGMVATLVTNGALLTPRRITALVQAGIKKVCISIDAASGETHDANCGLHGLTGRICRANAALRQHQIPFTASVTMSRLVDYEALPAMLRDLGFHAVTFSFPSSYLAWAHSTLVDFTAEGLDAAFEAIKALSREFPVQNRPRRSRTCSATCAASLNASRAWRDGKAFILIGTCGFGAAIIGTPRSATYGNSTGPNACATAAPRAWSIAIATIRSCSMSGIAVSDGVRAAARGNFGTDPRNLVSAQARADGQGLDAELIARAGEAR